MNVKIIEDPEMLQPGGMDSTRITTEVITRFPRAIPTYGVPTRSNVLC